MARTALEDLSAPRRTERGLHGQRGCGSWTNGIDLARSERRSWRRSPSADRAADRRRLRLFRRQRSAGAHDRRCSRSATDPAAAALRRNTIPRCAARRRGIADRAADLAAVCVLRHRVFARRRRACDRAAGPAPIARSASRAAQPSSSAASSFPPSCCPLLLFHIGLRLTRRPRVRRSRMPCRSRCVGEQWWWRVRYSRTAARCESANEIRIPVGRDVVFSLRSADVIHSFWIPSLGGKVDMIPGRDTSLRLHGRRGPASIAAPAPNIAAGRMRSWRCR